jgi:transposase
MDDPGEHGYMIHVQDVSAGSRGRQRRSISEKRRIVEQTFEPGASVAQVALANGVNANQVFSWRRAFKQGELVEPCSDSTALLPVVMVAPPDVPDKEHEPSAPEPRAEGRAIHIELPGRALITAEHGADPELLRATLESLRK